VPVFPVELILRKMSEEATEGELLDFLGTLRNRIEQAM
jgi:hypothetical protein